MSDSSPEPDDYPQDTEYSSAQLAGDVLFGVGMTILVAGFQIDSILSTARLLGAPQADGSCLYRFRDAAICEQLEIIAKDSDADRKLQKLPMVWLIFAVALYAAVFLGMCPAKLTRWVLHGCGVWAVCIVGYCLMWRVLAWWVEG